VLAPGMLVVALRLPVRPELAADCWFGRVNAVLVPAIEASVGVSPVCRGHGDLALVCADGAERKILGTSLRQTSRGVYYLGVLLIDDAIALMQRYLAPPSRQPDYRAGRGHSAFCTSLGANGAELSAVADAIRARSGALLAS
jgi:lipoate-protein ligase A